ncbi:MAG: hypothetical protein ABIJ97_15565, partial [Bacteroidota bacterium]
MRFKVFKIILLLLGLSFVLIKPAQAIECTGISKCWYNDNLGICSTEEWYTRSCNPDDSCMPEPCDVGACYIGDTCDYDVYVPPGTSCNSSSAASCQGKNVGDACNNGGTCADGNGDGACTCNGQNITPGYDANCIDHNIPDTWSAGETRDVYIKFINLGTVTWPGNLDVFMAFQRDPDGAFDFYCEKNVGGECDKRFGIYNSENEDDYYYIHLVPPFAPSGVATNEGVRMDFKMTAPTTVGTYLRQNWQMVVKWPNYIIFGTMCGPETIEVVTNPPTCSMTAGDLKPMINQSYNYNYTATGNAGGGNLTFLKLFETVAIDPPVFNQLTGSPCTTGSCTASKFWDSLGYKYVMCNAFNDTIPQDEVNSRCTGNPYKTVFDTWSDCDTDDSDQMTVAVVDEKTCTVSLNDNSIEAGESVTVTYSGNVNGPESDTVRVWVEKQDGSQVTLTLQPSPTTEWHNLDLDLYFYVSDNSCT